MRISTQTLSSVSSRASCQVEEDGVSKEERDGQEEERMGLLSQGADLRPCLTSPGSRQEGEGKGRGGNRLVSSHLKREWSALLITEFVEAEEAKLPTTQSI